MRYSNTDFLKSRMVTEKRILCELDFEQGRRNGPQERNEDSSVLENVIEVIWIDLARYQLLNFLRQLYSYLHVNYVGI